MLKHTTLKIFMGLCLFLAARKGLSQLPGGLHPVRDSVTMAATDKYVHSSFLRRFIMGRNYRHTWSVPVTAPVFSLRESGLKIKELGGGQQTKSLRLADLQNREWALRSVDKDAKGAVPLWARKTFIHKIIQDMISAAHPYAALPVGYLAVRAGVAAPFPKLYYIPDDPAFGTYRPIFQNTLCMLELREPTPDGSPTEKTDSLLALLLEKNNRLVLQPQVLRARLLDMLVADWDRHAGQWAWGRLDSGALSYYYAIPRDRDMAFFMSRGLLPRLAQSTAMKHLSRFNNNVTGLKALNSKSRSFDRLFLNRLDAQQWREGIKDFQQRLPDSVIIAALKQLPAEVFARDSALLAGKLISRRNAMEQQCMKYYRHLSRRVQVAGTEERELFRVEGGAEKNITVTVHRYKEGITVGEKIYERTFRPEETGTVYLLGYGGDDTFETGESASSGIRIVIFGGDGADRYNLKGALRSRIYEARSDNNEWINRSGAKVRRR